MRTAANQGRVLHASSSPRQNYGDPAGKESNSTFAAQPPLSVEQQRRLHEAYHRSLVFRWRHLCYTMVHALESPSRQAGLLIFFAMAICLVGGRLLQETGNAWGPNLHNLEHYDHSYENGVWCG